MLLVDRVRRHPLHSLRSLSRLPITIEIMFFAAPYDTIVLWSFLKKKGIFLISIPCYTYIYQPSLSIIVHDISWCLSPISVDLPSPLVMRIMHCSLTSMSSRSDNTLLCGPSYKTRHVELAVSDHLHDVHAPVLLASIVLFDKIQWGQWLRFGWFTTHIKGKNGDTFHYVQTFPKQAKGRTTPTAPCV